MSRLPLEWLALALGVPRTEQVESHEARSSIISYLSVSAGHRAIDKGVPLFL